MYPVLVIRYVSASKTCVYTSVRLYLLPNHHQPLWISVDNRALSANEEQSSRPVSFANAPKFILVGYALLNNKILVRSGPFRVLTKTVLLDSIHIWNQSGGIHSLWNSLLDDLKVS